MDTSDLEVESERLRLAAVKLEDAKKGFEEFSEKIAMYMRDKPLGDLDAFKKLVGEWIEKNKNGESWHFAIFDKKSGEFVGMGNVHKINTPTPGLGIWVEESSWGAWLWTRSCGSGDWVGEAEFGF